MLSVENPPDPPCSSKSSGSKNNERASEKLGFQEADLASSHLDDQIQLPKFSIRDYVVSARTKDIVKNWPFQHRYLQICLKHGVKEILPPFEPPDSVRAVSCAKKLGSDQLVPLVDGEKDVTVTDSIESEQVCSLDIETNDIKDESSPQNDESALGSSDGIQFPVSKVYFEGFGQKNDKLEKVSASTVTSDDWIEGKTSIDQNLPSSLLEPNATSEASIEQLEKESNLIENLDLITESSQTEGIILNPSLLLEPMTSKVCPVCKAFTSTSNTTLNAHIDQCLKVDSSSKLFVANQTEHKVKPRKKISMVDIYATAPRCTLEDLDRRNGTNWVESSSWWPSNVDLCKETKRQRVCPPSTAGEDDVNAVYVDSNGTKLRILSKLNDDLEPITREEIKRKKHLRVKPYSKKLSSLKPQKTESFEALKEASCMDDEGRKEKSLSQLQKAQVGTLRQWVCSKRSILPKQLFTNGIKDVVLPKQHQQKNGNSAREEHIPKTSRSLGNSDSFHSFKKLDSQLNPKQKTDNGRKVSLTPPAYDGCVLRFTRPSGNHVSSTRTKRVEIHSSADQNAGNVLMASPKLSGNHCQPAEAKKFSTLRKNTLLDGSDFPRKKKKCNENKDRLIFQKLPGTETHEFVGEMALETVEEYGCVRDSDYSFVSKSISLNKMNRTHKLNFPKNVTRSETAELVAIGTVGGSNLLENRYEPEMRSTTTQRKEKSILKRWKSGAKELKEKKKSILKRLKSGAKELKENKNMVLASVNGVDIGDLVVKSNKSSKDSSHIDQFDIQDCTLPVSRRETRVASEVPSFYSNQETPSEEITNEFSGQKDQKEAAINARLEKSLSGIDNMGANSALNQGLETSFSSQGDMGLEVLRDEPSIGNATDSPQSAASGRLLFAQDEHKHCDKDASWSPWVSSSGPSGLSSDTNSSRGGSTKFVSDSELPCGMIIADAGRRRLGQDDFKVGLVKPGKEPVVATDRICCSCKEYVYQETLPLSKQMTVARMLPSSWHDPRIDVSHLDLISMKENSGSAMKFPISSAQNFATGLAQSQAPPSPNPILRLMGKNLMVASKDEEDSNQLRGFSNVTSNNVPNTKYLTLLGFSTECGSNNDRVSSCHDGSLVFGPNLCNPLQNFVGVSKNFENHSYPLIDRGNHSEMYMGGFGASGIGLNSKSNAQIQQIKPNRKTNSAFSFNAERTAFPRQEDQVPVSAAQAARSAQEVIVIDDSPELEVDSSKVYASYSGSRTNQSSQAGSATAISNFSSKPAPTFCRFPLQSAFMYSDPPAGLGPKFLMSCPGSNTDLGKSGNSSGGSGVLLPNPYILPSVSTGHIKPTLYFSQRSR